ncbi:MAG: glycogen debranching protein GlgX [Pseudomonadota bacterium]
MIPDDRLSTGYPDPMGATLRDGGVNFAMFSAHATRVLLCLFDEHGEETDQIPLPERTGNIHHIFVSGLTVGQRYGYRVEGPYAVAQGHRFNPQKLLIDPYTRALDGELVWDPALMGYEGANTAYDLHPDRRDSAAFVPKSVVTEPLPLADEPRPQVPWSETVIYEAHVKGLTKQHPSVADPGTYSGVADPAIRAHLRALGVTTIELLPIQGFIEDAHLADRGLPNYWGYQTLTFFAPERRYARANPLAEVRDMVRTLHADGFEVVLDVVYNHTCEGDWAGPTLMMRGLDNASYYRLGPDGRSYVNDSGTGNTLNTGHPAVQRLILDSLRFWVQHIGVDGFRFDLGPVLGRENGPFDPGAALFDIIRQDPVLTRCKLIAEPWDIGPGGYQLGAFPPPFAEWNDHFRDTTRRFWRGDAGQVRHLAGVIAGSAAQFDHSGRRATSSVNLITAHDGFTLADVVSYSRRHNEVNGEDNRDGHSENHSDNMGAEGRTDDPEIRAARDRRRRAMMATLLLAQGTPMLLAGDELGNSQGGNNNGYTLDSAAGWLDWDTTDADFLAFVGSVIAFRASNPVLRQRRFLHALKRTRDGQTDLIWFHPEGRQMTDADWQDNDLLLLCAEIRMAAETPAFADSDTALLLAFNAGPESSLILPPAPVGRWSLAFSTMGKSLPPGHGHVTLPGQSVTVFRLTSDTS